MCFFFVVWLSAPWQWAFVKQRIDTGLQWTTGSISMVQYFTILTTQILYVRYFGSLDSMVLATVPGSKSQLRGNPIF